MGMLDETLESIKKSWLTYSILILVGYILPWILFRDSFVKPLMDLVIGVPCTLGIIKCALREFFTSISCYYWRFNRL